MAALAIPPFRDLARWTALPFLLGQALAAGPLRAPILPPTTAGPVPLLRAARSVTPISLPALARWEIAAGPDLADRVAERLWSVERPVGR